VIQILCQQDTGFRLMDDTKSTEGGDACSLDSRGPSRKFSRLVVLGMAPPYLATELRIVVHDSDTSAALCRASRSSHAGWSSSNHEDVEILTPVHYSPVLISIPSSHKT
jgi:hypothetical protein